MTENQFPVAPVVVCGTPNSATNPGNFTYLYSWNAVPGAVSYEFSIDNGVTWNPTNAQEGAETHATSNTENILIRGVGSQPCPEGAASEPTFCDILVYNLITQDGNDKNDHLEITNIEQYPNSNVQVFNRWGKEIFSMDHYNNTDSGKRFEGKDLPAGSYYYIINLNQGGREPKSGVVTITSK